MGLGDNKAEVMGWFFLFAAGACEMAWPLGFKYTHGFRQHLWAMGLTGAVMVLSFYLMSLATSRNIPVGTAYAVWTGIGAAGTAILGMMLFSEPADIRRIACLGLIIAGAAGLKLFERPALVQPAAEQTAH
jgi:quaternary ammonium compound-resistance protein SugE